MDKEQEEYQSLGYYGITSKSIKIIHSWRKILLKITLTLVLPLSIIFLSMIESSKLLKGKILHTQKVLDDTRQGNEAYSKITNSLSSEWGEVLLIGVVYYIVLVIFSLLSTSAIVYTVACAYSGKQITYKRVMGVVPKVFKRVFLTFLCNFIILIVFTICVSLFIALLFILPWGKHDIVLYVMFTILLLVYLIGFVHIILIWQLASVVSVLEDKCGFKAMAKGKALVKGRVKFLFRIFVTLYFFLVIIPVMFRIYVVENKSFGIVGQVGFGALSLVVLSLLFLFGFVEQTVIYFVCKSCHNEIIDKSALSDHLEAYRGDYVPLKAKDLQMEQV